MSNLLPDEFNPWRRNSRWDLANQLIKEFEGSVLKREPRLFYHISSGLMTSGSYGLITIRGPRRVGKTTMVMLLIRKLLLMGISPNNVFYISLDHKDSSGRPISPLKTISDVAGSSNQEKYLFMDEVSMYQNWATELKNAYDLGLIDSGKLKIVATGSHSMDLAESASKLRGRQGLLAERFNVGGNLLQPPLRFPEIVEGLQPQIEAYLSEKKFRKPGRRFQLLQSLGQGIIPEDLQFIYDNYLQLLQVTFEDYLIHGGYPKAVDEFYKSSPHKVMPQFYFNVAELLISDCATAGLDPENLTRILHFLLQPSRLSNQMSMENGPIIGRDDEGRSRGSFHIKEYLDYLKTTWSFFFPYPEGDECTPNYQGNPKVYVLDPFLCHALTSKINNIPNPFEKARQSAQNPVYRGQLVESVVASHLLLTQQLFVHIPAVDYERVLMFERTNTGEVDFVVCLMKDGARHRFTIESKYSESPAHMGKPTEDIKIILTKNKLEQREGKVLIPASLFLLLL